MKIVMVPLFDADREVGSYPYDVSAETGPSPPQVFHDGGIYGARWHDESARWRRPAPEYVPPARYVRFR